MATILSGIRQSGRDRPERQIEPSGAVWRTATLRAPDCLAGVQPARQPRARRYRAAPAMNAATT